MESVDPPARGAGAGSRLSKAAAMKRVLLTGASGFIGAHVAAELLRRGYEVHATVHSSALPEHPRLIPHRVNLLAPAELARLLQAGRYETLVHMAWYVGPKCHVHPGNVEWLAAGLHLLRLFAEHGGRVFVGAGSCSEYEYKYGLLTEGLTPTNPGTLYGNAKNAFYHMAALYCEQQGLVCKWPRIFNCYGPMEKPQRLMPAVMRACLRGEDVRVSDCCKRQDYLHVEDTARAIAAVLESPLQGAVNICSGVPVLLRRIVQLIAELTGSRSRILWGALPAAFGESLVVGNNDKLSSIGWAPTYSLEDGLRQTINWWKKHV